MSSSTLPVNSETHSIREKEKTDAPRSTLGVDQPGAAPTSSTTSISGDAGVAEKADGTPVPEESPRKVHGFLWGLTVVSILSSTFLFALDNTIVADIQPKIIERFGDIGKLPWLSVAFLLGALGTNLIWGKIYNEFDAKWLYILTVFLFEIGSAICGAANKMDVLVFGRALAGVGGAGMYTGVMTLLSVNTTPHERPMYLGLTGLTWGTGTVLGPIIGGAFSDSSATWRWSFYINLVIGAIFAPVYFFVLPSFDPRPGVSTKTRFRQIDYVGSILIIGAMVSGVMAISFGGITYTWNSGKIIGLFVCSGILFILFGFQQTYAIFTTIDQRLFPVDFLKSKMMLMLFVMTSCAVTIVYTPIFFIPLFFQFVRGDSALEAGVRLLPYVVFLVAFVVGNGAAMSKYGYYMPWYLFGGVFGIIGAALMYTVDEYSSVGRIYGYTILLGVGGGSICQTSFSVAQAKVEKNQISQAVGYITCAQIGGATIALAIANSIFINQSANQIVTLLPDVPLATVRGAIAGAGSAFFRTLSAEVRAQVIHIIVNSISKTYILAITAGALATVLSLFMKREKLFLEAAGAA
ncbi:MAG: hypothetical protein M1825_000482 [Sarcosagium campestre]|nr:MAG: hypothetical protein M1825_000482 [Sarcosagium campestre]